MIKTFIGIDPGVNTGFAVWKSEACNPGYFELLTTWSFWETIEALETYHVRSYLEEEELLVVLEDPNQNAPVWVRPGQQGRTHVKIGQNVGMNKRDAQLLADYCFRKKINIVLRKPQPGSMTKLSAESFKNITKFTRRTSEHSRDAGMLVFDMK